MEFSVIIPVFNEQSFINRSTDHVKTVFRNTRHEIVIVDGDEHSSTLKKITAKDIKKVSSSPGRAVQMNTGAHHSVGEILIFLHADTELPTDSPTLIEKALGQKVKAGAFNVKIDSKYLILRMISKSSSLHSRLTGHPYGYQIHFFDSDYFFRIGKYKEIPLMEDIEIMQLK